MPDLVFAQLVSIDQLQQLLSDQFQLIGVPCAILDLEERVLVAVGWQEICTRFHRRYPQTSRRCRESDAYIKAHLKDSPKGYVDYRCQNGLWEVAMPIFIEGRHLATFFIGQFFYKDDLPDREFFRAQAARFDFEESEYIAAMERVPVFSRSHIREVMNYCRLLVEMFAETGLKNLRLDREVEQRKKMEAALKEQESNLVEAQRIARVGNWAWDFSGQLQSASSECWRILGTSAKAFAGSQEEFWELVCAEDRERLRTAIAGLLRDGQPCAVEYRLRHADGEEVVIKDHRELVLDEAGRPKGMVGTIQDVTDQVRLAEELREKDLLLLQQSRMAAMGEMISYIAHQWRQPLHLLNLLIQNLANSEGGENHDEKLQQTKNQVEDLLLHMSLTIDDFRDFFRTDQRSTPFELKESASKILNLIAADLDKQGIETIFDAEDNLYVIGFGNEFSHVLLNILNNAKEALVAKDVAMPHIYIHLFREGDKKVVTVRDNAGGVPEAVRERLFEAHFTTKEGGNGIGLYISRIIIEKRLLGTISVRNTGDGLEFRIEL